MNNRINAEYLSRTVVSTNDAHLGHWCTEMRRDQFSHSRVRHVLPRLLFHAYLKMIRGRLFDRLFLAHADTLTLTYILDFVHKEHVRAANLAKWHTGRDDHLVALVR